MHNKKTSVPSATDLSTDSRTSPGTESSIQTHQGAVGLGTAKILDLRRAMRSRIVQQLVNQFGAQIDGIEYVRQETAPGSDGRSSGSGEQRNG